MLLSQNTSIHAGVGNSGREDRNPRCTPESVYALSGPPIAPLAAAALLICALALYLGFFVAPADAQQGEAYRIIFIHLPAAWMSKLLYLLLVPCAGVGLVFNVRLAPMMVQALAPTGATFAFLSLWSGCLWAKPVWGAWWVWDVRLISELALMVLYLGLVALQAIIVEPRLADKACALLALAGSVNIPVNALSVQWWTTLHQDPSIGLTAAPSMAPSVSAGALVMAAGFCCYAGAAMLLRLRCVILERERDSDWVAARGRISP